MTAADAGAIMTGAMTDTTMTVILRRQLDQSLRMLDDLIEACPDGLWAAPQGGAALADVPGRAAPQGGAALADVPGRAAHQGGAALADVPGRAAPDSPVWQQVMHALTGIRFWFREKDEPFEVPDLGAGPVPDLGTAPGPAADREAVRRYATSMNERVESYFAPLTDARLPEPSSLYAKCTHADIILGQVRHIQHHVGYCNCALRAGNAPAVKWRGYGE